MCFLLEMCLKLNILKVSSRLVRAALLIPVHHIDLILRLTGGWFSFLSYPFEQKHLAQASRPEWGKRSNSLPPAAAWSYDIISGLFEDETLNGKKRLERVNCLRHGAWRDRLMIFIPFRQIPFMLQSSLTRSKESVWAAQTGEPFRNRLRFVQHSNSSLSPTAWLLENV